MSSLLTVGGVHTMNAAAPQLRDGDCRNCSAAGLGWAGLGWAGLSGRGAGSELIIN